MRKTALFILTVATTICALLLPASAQDANNNTCAADLEITVNDLVERFNKNSKRNHFKVKMKQPVPLSGLNCNPDFIYYDLGVGEEVQAIATVSRTGDQHISRLIVEFFPDAKIRGTKDKLNFEKTYTDMVATLFQTLDGDSAHEPETYMNKIRMHPSLLMPDSKSPDHFVGKWWMHSTFWNSDCNTHCQAQICKLPPFVNHPLDFELARRNPDGATNHSPEFPQCRQDLDFGLSLAQLEHRFDALSAQQGYPITLQSNNSPHELKDNYMMPARYVVVPGIIADASGRFSIPKECGHIGGFGVETRPPRDQGGANFKIDNRRFLQIASNTLESACPQFGPKEKADIFDQLQMTQFANPNGPYHDVDLRTGIGDIHFYFGATLKPEGRYLQFSVTRVPVTPTLGQ